MIIVDGKVAIRHYSSNGAVEQVGDNVYTWQPKYQVSLAWVNVEDVPAILSIKVNGCCGMNRHKFVEANDFDVSIWETGHLP